MTEETIELTDLKLTRSQAQELADTTHAESGKVVEVTFQGGRAIAGRELTPQEKRDANRCPACRHTGAYREGPDTVSCKWCGWRGNPDTYVRPSLHLTKRVLRPFDHDRERNG